MGNCEGLQADCVNTVMLFQKKKSLFCNIFIGLPISDVLMWPPLRPGVRHLLFDSALRRKTLKTYCTASLECSQKIARWGLLNLEKGGKETSIGEKLLKHNEHPLFPRTTGCRVRDIKCFVGSKSDWHRSVQNPSFCLQSPITFKAKWWTAVYAEVHMHVLCFGDFCKQVWKTPMGSLIVFLSGHQGRE